MVRSFVMLNLKKNWQSLHGGGAIIHRWFVIFIISPAEIKAYIRVAIIRIRHALITHCLGFVW